MKTKKWIEQNTFDLSGKTIAITGSSGGIAKYVIENLLALNANLIFLDRNFEKSERYVKDFKLKFPKASIRTIKMDLCDLASVDKSIEQLKQTNIDAIIHNAGIYNVPITKTKDGLQNVFQTNFFAPYYMTKKLQPILSKSSLNKVIVLGSIAHGYTKLNQDDIQFESATKASKIYGNSKRFLMFAMHKLYNGSSALSICHPGVTLTKMTNHYPKAINWLVKICLKLTFPSPKSASLNVMYALFNHSPYAQWIGPAVFDVYGKPKIQKIKDFDEDEAQKMFEIAEKLYSKHSTQNDK